MRGKTFLIGCCLALTPLMAVCQPYTFRFAKSWGGAFEDAYHDVCIDSSGNTYAAGIVRPTSATVQVLVVKYSPTGTLLWSRSNIASAFQFGLVKICFDGSGDLVVASGGNTEMRLDKLNKTTGATIASKIMSEDKAVVRGLVYHVGK